MKQYISEKSFLLLPCPPSFPLPVSAPLCLSSFWMNSPSSSHLTPLPSFHPTLSTWPPEPVGIRHQRWPQGPLLLPECTCWRFNIHDWDQITAHRNHFLFPHVINYFLTRSMAPCCWGGTLHTWVKMVEADRQVWKTFWNDECVCVPVRSLPPSTTWLSCMGKEESTRKQSLCARERWRSEKR